MKVRNFAAALALALGTTIAAGAAHAATYVLNVDGCSASCLGSNSEVGTVTVTENSGKLNFSVALDNGALFNANGNNTHHALVFDFSTLANLGGLAFSNVTAGFTGSTAGPFSDPPFGSNWDYAVNYTGDAGQGHTPSSLSFTLSDTLNNLSLAMLNAPTTYSGKPIVFAADVYANGTTGNVGATLTQAPGVPEPATWGLMIVGVAAVGAAMRQRRAMTLA